MALAVSRAQTISRPNEPNRLSPPLKWAGGKRWQIPYLKLYWERAHDRRLVEPFCGGLAATLGLQPQHALLNDVNPHLINFYHWLKRGLSISLEMSNSQPLFYAHRDRFNELLRQRKHKTKEAASLFYYLNRTGYNGLCRFNSSGQFNVPFGRYNAIQYRTNFAEYKNLFQTWSFANVSFDRLPLQPDDFVYADPPYDVEFREYSSGGFGWADQMRTAEWLAEHPGPVVLSNQATDRILKLYSSLKYHVTFLKAPRRISCTGDRTPALEVLATRNLAT